jgi:hypothetical protein
MRRKEFISFLGSAATCLPAASAAAIQSRRQTRPGRFIILKTLSALHPELPVAMRLPRRLEDRKSAWPHRAALVACSRRRGDRIEMLFAAAHESVCGPPRTLGRSVRGRLFSPFSRVTPSQSARLGYQTRRVPRLHPCNGASS